MVEIRTSGNLIDPDTMNPLADDSKEMIMEIPDHHYRPISAKKKRKAQRKTRKESRRRNRRK